MALLFNNKHVTGSCRIAAIAFRGELVLVSDLQTLTNDHLVGRAGTAGNERDVAKTFSIGLQMTLPAAVLDWYVCW